MSASWFTAGALAVPATLVLWGAFDRLARRSRRHDRPVWTIADQRWLAEQHIRPVTVGDGHVQPQPLAGD